MIRDMRLVALVAAVFLALGLYLLSTRTTVYGQIETVQDALKDNRMNQLPNYGAYYDGNKVSLDSGALSVCTPKDVPLVSSDPRPSAGCQNRKPPPGFKLICRHPEPVTCDMSLSRARETFYRNFVRLSAECHGPRDLGDEKKDGKWRTCMSGPYVLKKNACMVYSFGIHDEWSFDDTLSQVYRCQVNSFDPSMKAPDHKRDDKISFYKMGVKGHGSGYTAQFQHKWKLLSIEKIIELLGHQNRTIDILKVDVDFTEWDAFEDLLKTNKLRNVKQIVTEFHVWTDHAYAYVRFYRILTALQSAGFEKWYINKKVTMKFNAINPDTGKSREYHHQMDASYINIKFLQ